MATTPPLLANHNRTRSRSGSQSLVLPPPIPLSSSPAAATSPTTSALSASLKAFQGLALSPDSSTSSSSLDTPEFREAFHHARRTSFSNQQQQRPTRIDIPDAPLSTGDVATPVLSTSPGSSEATSLSGSLPTPSSSPSALSASAPPATTAPLSSSQTTTAPVTNGKARTASSGAGSKLGKPSSTLGGVCEQDELAMERGEVSSSSPPQPASSSLFSGGARWGWSSVGGAVPLPSPTDCSLTVAAQVSQRRRSSITFSPPPSTAALRAPGSSSPNGTTSPLPVTGGDPFRMMQPLGRVVSAGAALQTPNSGASGGGGAGGGGGGKDGFGIFRRFSISGLGKTRPTPPSAPLPPSAAPAPTLSPPTVLSTAPTSSDALGVAAAAANKTPLQRGRSLGVTGGKAAQKRRISPMGEKILRGGY